jgi:hypothetical protein
MNRCNGWFFGRLDPMGDCDLVVSVVSDKMDRHGSYVVDPPGGAPSAPAPWLPTHPTLPERSEAPGRGRRMG